MQCIGIIPARYASSRFPGKPLAIIGNKTMIRRVYEQALKSQKINKVFVATDDNRIEKHVKEFGNVIMTKPEHKSGTERCGEVAEKLISENVLNTNDAIINIQGDEPFINPEQIDQLAKTLENQDVQIATLAKKINSSETLFDENCVKVVISKSLKALYFSRAPIPYCRNTDTEIWLKKHNYLQHIGLYGYKTNVLLKITKLPETSLENTEALEQLRWTFNDYDIHVGITEHDSYNVDVKEDIEKIPKSLY